jgi:hypothetical protein
METKIRNIGAFDKETGEVFEHVPVWVKGKIGFNGNQNYFCMFQNALREVSKMDLDGKTIKVLNFLMATMDMENVCLVPFKYIASELKMNRPNVSRAIKQLQDHNIIIKGEKVGNTPSIRINNTLLWKGKVVNFNKKQQDTPIVPDEAYEKRQKQLKLFEDNIKK